MVVSSICPAIAINGRKLSDVQNFSFRRDVGLAPPPLRDTVLWICLYAIWMLTTDILMQWRTPAHINPLRIAALVLFAPFAEELLFRGYAQGLLRRTALAGYGSVIVVAIAWAAFQYRYSGGDVMLLVVCGLLLGMARETTGSVVTPWIMHSIWNLYAFVS